MNFLYNPAMVDLHCHSTASDGEKSPRELILYGKECGLSVQALTDHDTVSGLDEAAAAAREVRIVFVPGIELNIIWPTGEFHLLGLGLFRLHESLLGIIGRMQDERKARNRKIIQALNAAGFSADYSELLDFCRKSGEHSEETLGRPHIAAYMVEKKIVRKRQQAFDKFLAKGQPFYTGGAGADLDECIAAIKNCGGVPVLAHPLSLYVGWSRIEDILAGIRARGVEGLEAWHSGAREVDCERLERLARKLGFFVTAGSDFHGDSVRAGRKLGRTAGQRKIEDRFYYEELLPRLKIPD